MSAGEGADDPPDDRSLIADADGLIRHCQSKERPPIPLPEGGYRIPSNVFSLRLKQGETYASVDLEALMSRAGLAPTHYVNRETHWAVRIEAARVRALLLGITHEPEGHHPHHGGIHGMHSMRTHPREKTQKRLAEQSEIILLPTGRLEKPLALTAAG